MDIYVGNLPFSATEDEVRAAFSPHGSVSNVNLITDRDTGRPRGFGFVTMDDDNEARAAIEALDQSDMGGRQLNVNQARGKKSGGRGGGGW